VQPFDYRQQVVNPFEQAIGSAMKGFQLGASIRDVQQQQLQAEEARKRQEELQAKIGGLMQKENPTFRDYEEVAVLLPKDAAEGLRKNYELRSKESKDNAQKFSGQLVAALTSPDPESRKRGIDLMRQRAEAERNSGNNEEAEAYELHANIAETGPDGAKAVVNEVMVMGTATFGKDWAEGILKVREEPDAGFRPVTRADRARFAAEGSPLPEGVPFQIGPKGEIKEVSRGPLVTVDTGAKRDTLALKELDIPRAKEFSDAAASARSLANSSRVISNLLKGSSGGRAVKLTTEIKRDLGFESDTVTANDLVNALATRGAVQIRAPGSGATSDLEFKSYLQAFPSLANSEAGRELMAKYAEAFAKRSARLADHARKLIREDKYTEEEIARFDESLGPVLDEAFYAFARGRRPGVPQFSSQAAPADRSIRNRADEIIRGR
jgi:hypothetical protein